MKNAGNDMDQLIMSIPGMEGKIRRRDLPSFFRVGDPSDPALHSMMSETGRTPEAHALILNTTEDLESPILARIRSHCPRVYALGPLHALLQSRLPAASGTAQPPPSLSNSLWEEDRSCIAWLDAQPPGSVIYVSLGSISVMTEGETREFWHGLVNSGVRFLWVLRPDSVVGLGGGPAAGILPVESTTMGRVVGWAPQEEVLAHRAVGGFLTHSGWNSTLESMAAGKPMLCWAYFADQQINSRFVSEVWRVGLDMKDTCDRATVERLVRDLMVERKDELRKSAAAMAESVRRNVAEGGASYRDLERLIEDIRRMSVGPLQ